MSNPQPYDLNETAKGFIFTTDKGAAYELYFGDGKAYLGDVPLANQTVIFGFTLLRPADTEGYDKRIEPTIQTFILQTLTEVPDLIILYNASSEGGKQYSRSSLFSRWFRKVDSDYTKLDYLIAPAGGGMAVPVSAILRADHPDLDKVGPAIQYYASINSKLLTP